MFSNGNGEVFVRTNLKGMEFTSGNRISAAERLQLVWSLVIHLKIRGGILLTLHEQRVLATVKMVSIDNRDFCNRMFDVGCLQFSRIGLANWRFSCYKMADDMTFAQVCLVRWRWQLSFSVTRFFRWKLIAGEARGESRLYILVQMKNMLFGGSGCFIA